MMMIQFTVSAPGKVILYGEHAVVYGKTAIAASLDLRTTVKFKELPDTERVIEISCPKVSLDRKIILIEHVYRFLLNDEIGTSGQDHESLLNHIQQFVQKVVGYTTAQQKLSLEAIFYLLVYMYQRESFQLIPFQIVATSELSLGSGLGSSASFAVCLAACFYHLSRIQRNICESLNVDDLERISNYAFNCEKVMHGTPSGIDNSVCTFGSIIEFRKDTGVKQISGIRSMKILLVDTRVQRSTKTLVNRVIDLKQKYPSIVNLIFDSIDNISKEAITVLKRIRDLPENDSTVLLEEYRQLMVLITMNHGLLATCQVSHPSLDRICAEAQNYALAAKLTGAGGGGYAYILLMPDTQPETISSISRKLIADGYSVTLTSLGCSGLKVSN